MNKIYGIIYMVRNTVNNKIYFGQTTKTFKERYNYSIKNTKNQHLKNAIEKYGVDNFEIIEEFDIAYSKEELDGLEKLYIGVYNTTNSKFGYNKMDGGYNGKPNNEVRKKLSERQIGELNHNYGKETPQDVRDKISQTLKERYKTQEHHSKGIKLSEEHKAKVLPNLLHDQTGSNNPSARAVYSPTLKRKFDTVKQAEEFIGKQGVGKCCNPKCKNKTCGETEDGVRVEWVYYDEWLMSQMEEIDYGE